MCVYVSLCVWFVGWVWGAAAAAAAVRELRTAPFALFRAKRSLSFLSCVVSETLRIGRPRNTSRYATPSAPFPFQTLLFPFSPVSGETPRPEIPSDILSSQTPIRSEKRSDHPRKVRYPARILHLSAYRIMWRSSIGLRANIGREDAGIRTMKVPAAGVAANPCDGKTKEIACSCSCCCFLLSFFGEWGVDTCHVQGRGRAA